jgi:hypothetical protein
VADKYDALADATEVDPEGLRPYWCEEHDGPFDEYVSATVTRLREDAAGARRRAVDADIRRQSAAEVGVRLIAWPSQAGVTAPPIC